MGRSFHVVNRLQAPLRQVDERVTFIPRGDSVRVDNVGFKFLFFIVADCRVLFDDCQPLRIASGDILVVPGNCTQKYEFVGPQSEGRLHSFRLTLHAERRSRGRCPNRPLTAKNPETDLRAFLKQSFPTVTHLPFGVTPDVLQLFGDIRQEAEAQTPGFRHRVSGICLDLLVRTARLMDNTPAGSAATTVSRSQLLVEQAKEFLLEHLAEPLTLARVAWHVRLSREYLATLFRRVVGQSVFEYLAHLRLERAKDLLLGTSAPANAIARQAGFSSAALFSRNFKAATGLTPQRYRLQQAGTLRYTQSKRHGPQKACR